VHSDNISTCRWLSDSVHNAWLSIPGLTNNSAVKFNQIHAESTHSDLKAAGLYNRTNVDKVRCLRGLRSGERNTNFTNSLLNRTQLLMVIEDANRLFPGIATMESYHKGDDVAGWVSGY